MTRIKGGSTGHVDTEDKARVPLIVDPEGGVAYNSRQTGSAALIPPHQITEHVKYLLHRDMGGGRTYCSVLFNFGVRYVSKKLNFCLHNESRTPGGEKRGYMRPC